MDIDKIKKICNLLTAKILFVFGWLLDFCMKILNAVNKTPIEDDKERHAVRVKQFAIASVVFYCFRNSTIIFICKSLRRVSSSGSYISNHFMPWNIIVPYSFWLLIPEIILSLIVGIGVTVKLHTLYRMKNDSKNVKGDNKFMEDDVLNESFLAVPMNDIKSAEKSGMIIGESNGIYYIETGTYNTLTVGATRSGKGECYVLPSLRAMANSKEKPSVIINDMKGELLEHTYDEFRKNGYKIVIINLIDTEKSDYWNPLQLIIDEYLKVRRSGGNDFSQTSKLVGSFAHCITDDARSEAVWTNSARSLLSAMIYYFLDQGYASGDMSKVNMYSITTFFTEFGTYNTVIDLPDGSQKEVNALDEIFSQLPTGCLAKLAYSTSKFSQGDTRSSIYTVLSSDLEIFTTDMGIQKLTSKNEIDFNDLVSDDQPCVIYMLVPFEEKSRYVIASMFVDQCFLFLARHARRCPDGKLTRKVEFVLDEFGQMTKLPDLSSKMNVSAGCNILFVLRKVKLAERILSKFVVLFGRSEEIFLSRLRILIILQIMFSESILRKMIVILICRFSKVIFSKHKISEFVCQIKLTESIFGKRIIMLVGGGFQILFGKIEVFFCSKSVHIHHADFVKQIIIGLILAFKFKKTC